MTVTTVINDRSVGLPLISSELELLQQRMSSSTLDDGHHAATVKEANKAVDPLALLAAASGSDEESKQPISRAEEEEEEEDPTLANEMGRLLDRYPLSEIELRQLMLWLSRRSEEARDYYSFQQLFDILAPLDSIPHSAEEEEDRDNETSPASLPSDHNPHRDEVLAVLPELPTVFQSATERVVVVPSFALAFDERTDQEDANNNQRTTHQQQLFELETALEAVCSLLGRRGSGGGEQFVYDVLFDSFIVAVSPSAHDSRGMRVEKEGEEEDEASRVELMSFLHRVGAVAARGSFRAVLQDPSLSSYPPDGWCRSLSSAGGGKSSSSSKATMCRGEWREWTVGNQLHRCFTTVFHLALRFEPRTPPLEFPPSRLFSMGESIGLVAMGIFGNRPYDPRSVLYDSDENGLSFRILQEALLGFWGPTALIVRTTSGDCLGYYTRVPWKVSPKWYTGDDNSGDAVDETSFLFRLSPLWNRYPMKTSLLPRRRPPPFHQYLNVEPASAQHGANQQGLCVLKGLAVGGVAPDSPRFHLKENLEGVCSPVDRAFAPGCLLSTDDVYFDVDRILVFALWDCDDEFERGIRLGGRQVRSRESARVRAAKVDRGQFVDEVEHLTSLFGHRDQARGRCDFAAMDDVSKGYYVVGKPPSARSLGDASREESESDSDS